ncbi:hypothetical protein [Demequina sp. NBRC 110053]|uniref:hypothetical protein n=1 Tax=Demequina sp. NBRC 110053 TaxID=1570342 RepID=UPI0009FDCDE2|nr:hypothetical protein [Demequina sp. NBRC 110053]
MAADARDDGSWSRAFMASSGLGTSQVRRRQVSPEWHEASGAELPRPRFAQLAHHRDVDVREVLGRREDCPLAVLASLSHDARAAVRAAVGANPAANAAVLEHLASDRDSSVLRAVAHNRATPDAVRARLLDHRRAEVRRAAERAVAELAAERQDRGPSTAGGGLPAELHDRALDSAGLRSGEASPADAPSRRTSPRAYAPRPAVGRGREGAVPASKRAASVTLGGILPVQFSPEGPQPGIG